MVAYESLNTKKKPSWVTPKVVAVACESFSSQRLSQILNGDFTKAVVTRASRLREWSQREPRLWGGGAFIRVDSDPLTILYTIFEGNTPFVYVSLKNGIPFTYLV